MNLTSEDVQEIVRLLDNSTFDELRIETASFKLTLRRTAGQNGGWTQETQTLRQSGSAKSPIVKGPVQQVVLEAGTAAVRAPLVGTFYRAPKPGAAPFVEPGSEVDEDTVVAIIETMKLMNSVHAGIRGTVAAILAENAEFVEHGRVLMTVKTGAS